MPRIMKHKTAIIVLTSSAVVVEFFILAFLIFTTPQVKHDIISPTTAPHEWPPTWTPTPRVYPTEIPKNRIDTSLSIRCHYIEQWARETIVNIKASEEIDNSISEITVDTPASVLFDISNEYAILSTSQSSVQTTEDTALINQTIVDSFDAASLATRYLGLSLIDGSTEMADRALKYTNLAVSFMKSAIKQTDDLANMCGITPINEF